MNILVSYLPLMMKGFNWKTKPNHCQVSDVISELTLFLVMEWKLLFSRKSNNPLTAGSK